MRAIRKVGRRLYFLLNRRRLERELAEEMETHREMMPADRRSQFGRTGRLREESREAWSWNWIEESLQDLAYGARVLSRAPGFTLGAVAVLALGVGVNLAEFEIFDAMIFHRIGIRDASSVLLFSLVSPQGQRLAFPHSAADLCRTQSRSFAWLVTEDPSYTVVVEGDADLHATSVSANYFGSLGVLPAWGRLLDARDAEPGAPPAAVLSYPYWQTRWAGDPNVVGRIVRINNLPARIVGVLPADFNGLWSRGTAVWLPPRTDSAHAGVLLFGRVRTGVSRAAGAAELTSLIREWAREQTGSFREPQQVQSRPVQESMARAVQQSPAIAIFIAMVLLVLLSACANLGNMLLARGLARQREIGIRLAVGASRARVIRQLMTENVALALLGAAAGAGFGTAAARLLLIAMDAPPGFRVSIRGPELVAGFVLTIFSALTFGLPAALQTAGREHRKIRLRRSLAGVQVAVSCLLLIAAGVLAHNGILSASIPLAFDYPNMIVVNPQFSGQNLPAAVARQKLDEINARLGALPGVTGVTAAENPPFSGRVTMDRLPGLPHIYRNAVAPSYFGVMNLPVVLGRTFLPQETNAVMVSESAARAIWPNADPVGKVWNVAGAARMVTGVVKDSGANLLTETDSVEVYTPMQGGERNAFIVHARGDLTALVRMIPAAVDEPVSVSLMRSGRDRFLETQRRMVTLIGSVGAVAAALASAGLFALVAFAVAQRKREIGIRIAIGGTGRHVLGTLLRQHARPMAIGMAAGTLLALILCRLVRSMVVMPNADAVDLAGFAAGLVCFVLVAALATLSPAMRAVRIDPAATLRED